MDDFDEEYLLKEKDGALQESHCNWGGGKLWRLTPNGLLPACGELCLWVASLAAALFHRWWLYALMVGLLILMDI